MAMAPALMETTTLLTGLLPAVIAVASLFTAMASLILLWLYRRAVVRGMSKGAATPPRGRSVAAAPAELRPALVIAHTDAFAPNPEARGLLQASSASLRALAACYLIAGACYAAVMALPWLITAGDGLPPLRAAWFLVVFAWPAVLAVVMVVVEGGGARVPLAGYALLLALVGGAALAVSEPLTPGQLLYLWCFANLPATVLLALVRFRPVRAVAPLVLPVMLLGLTGAGLLVLAAGGSDRALRLLVQLGQPLGLGAVGIFIALLLIGFAALGLVGWWLLRRLGTAYRRKHFSDRSLSIDTLWALFAVLHCFTLSFEGPLWILAAPAAFAVYRLSFAACCRALLPPAGLPRSLLLLRVFALGRRSRVLYDALSSRWLRLGNIDMIAGPDLATSTVEPDEFLDFVGGRLGQRFVEDPGTAARRVAERDLHPDPDGYHRVNEFFCRDHTWRSMVQALAREDTAVLMDLRSFSPDNAGCRWELQQLLDTVPLERVLLLVDASTDVAYLEQTLQQLWAEVDAGSPNLPGTPRIHVMRLEKGPRSAIGALLGLVSGARPAAAQ